MKHYFITPTDKQFPEDRFCAQCGEYFTHTDHHANDCQCKQCKPITAVIKQYDTTCDLILSDDSAFTGKITILKGYCKKNNIKITEIVDCKTKKESTVFDPFKW